MVTVLKKNSRQLPPCARSLNLDAVEMRRTVILKNLLRMPYNDALNVQMTMVNRHLNALKEGVGRPQTETMPSQLDTLLIVEHPPVYTVGIRTAEYSVDEESRLRALGADFQRTNRGGLITFHGPGQLVVYPILNLANYTKSVKWYVCTLEKTMISTCRALGVEASTCEHVGVWVGDRKIGAIGVHAKRFITSHGIALNCNVDLKWFDHIVPCGIPNRGVTSLSQELSRDVTVEQALNEFLKAFQMHFNCTLTNADDHL